MNIVADTREHKKCEECNIGIFRTEKICHSCELKQQDTKYQMYFGYEEDEIQQVANTKKRLLNWAKIQADGNHIYATIIDTKKDTITQYYVTANTARRVEFY